MSDLEREFARKALLVDRNGSYLRLRHEKIEVTHTIGPEARFKNERVAAIAPRDPNVVIARRDPPAAMLVVAEQRGEAGFGIETRPAQPVDRAVAPDQGGGLAIADQGMVLDAR